MNLLSVVSEGVEGVEGVVAGFINRKGLAGLL